MIDFFLHLEQLLPVLLAEYGLWIYAILFLIIFALYTTKIDNSLK